MDPITLILLSAAIAGAGKLTTHITGKQIAKETEADIADIEAKYRAEQARKDIIYSTETISESERKFYEQREQEKQQKTIRNVLIGSTAAIGGFLLFNK